MNIYLALIFGILGALLLGAIGFLIGGFTGFIIAGCIPCNRDAFWESLVQSEHMRDWMLNEAPKYVSKPVSEATPALRPLEIHRKTLNTKQAAPKRNTLEANTKAPVLFSRSRHIEFLSLDVAIAAINGGTKSVVARYAGSKGKDSSVRRNYHDLSSSISGSFDCEFNSLEDDSFGVQYDVEDSIGSPDLCLPHLCGRGNDLSESYFGDCTDLLGELSRPQDNDSLLLACSSAEFMSTNNDDFAVNPANGNLMVGGVGGIDTEGNSYGTDSLSNDDITLFDTDYSSDDGVGFDSFESDSFDSDSFDSDTFDSDFTSGGFDDDW
ncbi:hypothetical protein VCHA50P416_280011 [Vibrio chagasii]|nr:hypothetical protein VCHA42P256_270012 [Vibrio chagasii]CAH7125725.1 hypothetical protein VCHA52P454_260011 [Vibrio chagasii]CAH7142146.1 hypothetical protein VCHA43P272_290036 [Vibrio chagasii]CAH7330742.1 hypothetical protein VCHA50P416_280011 [Vibrio chagasii]